MSAPVDYIATDEDWPPPAPEPPDVGVLTPATAGGGDRAPWHDRHWAGEPIEPKPIQWRPGGEFVLDAPERIPAVWGADDQVAWSEGEPILVAGQVGTGKSTVAQQIALHRIGVLDGNFLGLPIAPSSGRVLYIAADRPQQIRRSMRRMTGPEHRRLLDDRLVPWVGPLPFNLSTQPEQMLAMVEEASRHRPELGPVDTVVIDSLKDVALDLSSDETGARVALCMQQLVSAGIEVLVLHHDRKRTGGEKGKRIQTIDDLYGSRWIPAVMGSVLLIEGQPGDAFVTVRHLKQPAEEIGPLKVMHDHGTGRSSVVDFVDLVALAGSMKGITAADAARAINGTDPDKNMTERARRRLQKLVDLALLVERPGMKGGAAGGTPSTWHPTTRLVEPPTASTGPAQGSMGAP